MFKNDNQTTMVELQMASWREQMLNRLLPLTAGIATVGIVIGIISVISRERWLYLSIYLGVYVALLVITFFQRIPYTTRAPVLLALIALMGIAVLSETGLSGEGRAFLLVLPIAAMALMGWRHALYGLAFSTGFLLLYGGLVSLGVILHPATSTDYSEQFIAWALAATLTAMLITAVIVSLRTIIQNLADTLTNEETTTKQLREISDHLEQKVSDRTQALQQRSSQVALAIEISQALGSLHEPEELLEQAADLLLDRLGFSYVGIYLLDNTREQGFLRAIAGSPGPGRVTAEPVVRVGERSPLGWCLATGKGDLITENSQPRPGLRSKPLSAIVLPLRAGDQVIGALDVQRVGVPLLDMQELDALQDSADLLAVLVDNAQRYQQAQAELMSLRTANQRMRQQTWQQFRQSAMADFAEYHQPNVSAWSQDRVTELADPGRPTPEHVLAFPLLSHGEEIGQLVIEAAPGQDDWSDAQLDYVNQVAVQVTAALEGARLFEQSQNRAMREQLGSEIASRMQASLDPDTIVKTAVRELGRALGAEWASIQIGGPGEEK